ncbi:MAG: hypothetical protein Q8M01_19635 [Rubrivivax sp.]|nr:hypothetical protein [Rubrivivax sp.]
MNTDTTIIDAFLGATGSVIDDAIASIRAEDVQTWAATVMALQAGAPLTVATTIVLGGRVSIEVTIAAPNGTTALLAKIEMQSRDTPTAH